MVGFPGGLAGLGPLTRMVGFRNVLVHGYQEVDKAVVRDVVENRLENLDAYVAAIHDRLHP